MSALSHILASDPEPAAPSASPDHKPASAQDPHKARRKEIMVGKGEKKYADELHMTPKAAHAGTGDEATLADGTASTKRNAGSAANSSSVYGQNKLKHLKKEDGIPLWRKDIQYDFLRGVLRDETPAFTKFSEGTTGHTFAEVYIDAMAKSSKCSKILKDKLLQEMEGAITMAMVCLLVNIGRMNTTLNFFPEMRAQLRTYHSIPALQAHQDVTTYKQLQDAPRLKSILKGAEEDTAQPATIEDMRIKPRPRSNAVNLIFVMGKFCPKITELHFSDDLDFFDLIMKTDLSSADRSKAFLWLMWWYLESDFTYEDSQRNPFGPGEVSEGDRNADPLPVKVPKMRVLTEEEEALENIDEEMERQFGEDKRQERLKILSSEPSPAMTALKRARKEKSMTLSAHLARRAAERGDGDDGSEAGWADKASAFNVETASERTRSPSPGAGHGFASVNKPAGDMRITSFLNDDSALDQSPQPHATPTGQPARKGPGRGNWRRHLKGEAGVGRGKGSDASHQKTLLPNISSKLMSEPSQHTLGGWDSTPRNAGTSSFSISLHKNDHVPTPSYQASKRSRGMTQHQSAVVNHRKQQIDYSLDRRIRKAHERARVKRENESTIIRAWKRVRTMPLDYDSEEEAVRIRRARERADKDSDDWRSLSHRNNKDNDDFLDNVELWRRPRMLYAGFVRSQGEASDVGEESKSLAQSMRRVSRRLLRWQEDNFPGQTILRRMEIEAAGGFKPRPRRSSLASVDLDADVDDEVEVVLAAPAPSRGRGRGGHKGAPSGRGRGRRGNENAVKEESKMDLDPEPDEEDGAAELDEEDREILGEVDADESEEEEDEDEAMEE